jgi:hypothetical protein
MKKRVFIIHCWEGTPEKHWYPWVKKELEKLGFEVHVPSMPNTEHPKISAWISTLEKLASPVDEKTYFIGHSIGCQTILRFLQTLPEEARIGGAILVAGFFNLKELETEEEKQIIKPWLETPIDSEKIKRICPNVIAFFSDDDPYVPTSEAKVFKERLDSTNFVDEKRGHFTKRDGATEMPEVLHELKKLDANSSV